MSFSKSKFYRAIPYLWLLVFFAGPLLSQQENTAILPARGLSIAAPQKGEVDKFVDFVDQQQPWVTFDRMFEKIKNLSGS
ncbi:hypothetical protein [Cyclobacterium salsum]|uniref:hypothetical protein n=1 Tax=Cyclobacterium salsum TaxID=2666329 RepID=UPI001390919E|nr:hypothetical protein [Cyclobacterium salsum]